MWAVVSGYQDRIEDLRAHAKKFEAFFSPYVLPERGANAVLVELQSEAGKVYTRTLDLSAETPPEGSAALAAWVASALNVEESALSNVRYGVDPLRLVDANILDYLATNIGAVLYKSGLNEKLDSRVTQSGTYTGAQFAHQKLIETYFPRLKFKGTAQSFEALAKLMGFDDLRMVPLWQRVSLRLPSDPGAPANDADVSQVPEFWPRQELGPHYDPLVHDDGPFYAWNGTVSPGTASTDFYTQVVNGHQPYVTVTVTGLANGTGAVEHPASGTYALAGGAAHQKASASAGPFLFRALGEGESWNGLTVDVYTVANGTLRGLGISDRLSAIKYRSSYYDLTLGIEPDRADTLFGTLVARRNTDLALEPHHYVSFGSVLTAVSPYRPYVGGTLTLQQTPSDFMVPFTGTQVVYVERREAGLTDYQIAYTDISRAAAQVTQALEEVRAATRFPRKTSVGWVVDEQVRYAAYVSCAFIGTVTPGSFYRQFTGTFAQYPLPPYTANVLFVDGGTLGPLAAESRETTPETLYYRQVVEGGTLQGRITFTGTGSNSYDFLTSGTFARPGTLSTEFTTADGYNQQGQWVKSTEVVRPDAWVTTYGTGTWAFAVIGDYGLDIPSVHEMQRPTAALVHSWNPTAIFTTGDNNYYSGEPATIHRNNYAYWEDIRLGRFFPAFGNHDYYYSSSGTETAQQIAYFFSASGTIPGNGRYYSVRKGNVEWFVLNGGYNTSQVGAATGDYSVLPNAESDGNSWDSVQGQWLKRALRNSSARWKLVTVHQGPYHSQTLSGGYYPGYPRLRWPFKEWGADLLFCGHVHAYERAEVDAFNYVTIGCSGESNRTYVDPRIPGLKATFCPPAGASGTDPLYYGAVRVLATDEWLQMDAVQTATGAIVDSLRLEKCRKYQARPEDELGPELVYETADDYPWRRDIVGGGELVETDYYTAGTVVTQVLIAHDTTVVWDQSGAPYNVYVATGTTGPRFLLEERSTDPYRPGQRALAYKGTFRDQAQLTDNDLSLVVNSADGANQRTAFSKADLDAVFNPGYALYHAGLVRGVLVADPVRFNGPHHRDGLVGWLPLNEHPLDNLAVTDRVKGLGVQVLRGIEGSDRKLDTDHGRYLHIRPGCQLLASADRDASADLAFSFWIACDSGTAASVGTVVSWGRVAFELDFATGILTASVTGTDGVAVSLGTCSVTAWTFVYVRKSSTAATLGYGNLSTVPVEVEVEAALADNATDDPIIVSSPEAALGFAIRDVRAWNQAKTAAEMRKVWDYAPVSTNVHYRLGHVLSAQRGDRYGLRVLPTGWLVADSLPAWVRTPKYARVVRYDGVGQYDGESSRKEVGLGGGQVPPYTYTLGQVGYNLTAAGTTVVSTQHGALPGTNAYWGKDATGALGYHIVLSGGSIASGSIAVSTLSGSGASPWPNAMEATNPFVDRIWIEGLSGTIYEANLQASTTGAVWTAKEAAWQGTVQQESGAMAALAKGPVCISVTTYGSVCQTSCSGTGTTSPLYLYLHENLLEDVGGAQTFSRWTDPTSLGLSAGVPVLAEAGEMAFSNTANLPAGNYKLWLDGGNLGRVDEEFDGFRLQITIGDTTLDRTFLAGYKGSDFRGQQEFEFALPDATVGEWLLTLVWTNSVSDQARGTARQLVIYGYKLIRLETSLWQASIASSGTTPDLTALPIAGAWTSTPGGWLAQYNSFGTVHTWAHEGTLYPGNDTLTSKYPTADLLTGVTERRREDVLVLADSVAGSPFFNLPDAADPVIAAFGTDTGVG